MTSLLLLLAVHFLTLDWDELLGLCSHALLSNQNFYLLLVCNALTRLLKSKVTFNTLVE